MPKVNAADASSSGRHGRGRRVATSLSEINVVPMVDVMLVLLIIFMVAAPMIQRGVDVNLPVARNAQQMTGDRVEITVPLAYRQNRIVFLGREPVRASVLQERIRQKMETAAKKDVYLGGDRRRESRRADGSVLACSNRPAWSTSASKPTSLPSVSDSAAMDVTDVLRDRRHEPDGLTRMAAISLAVHGALAAFLVLRPDALVSRSGRATRNQ